MPGFLTLRYKNNTLSVQLKELKELMDLTKCDTLAVPLKCNPKACESILNILSNLIQLKFLNNINLIYLRFMKSWYW